MTRRTTSRKRKNISTTQLNLSSSSVQYLQPGENYHSIKFAGCGFLLSYHFGVVHCLLDNNITVDHAVGISGGTMAALALLGGSDVYIGIRQGISDLSNECCGFLLLGFNFFFMNYYFQYCWNYVCLRPTHSTYLRNKNAINKICGSSDFEYQFHDMSERCKQGSELSSKLHILAVASSFTTRSIKPVVINQFADHKSVVRACVLGGGIPGITTFLPRRLHENDGASVFDAWYVSDPLASSYQVCDSVRPNTNPLTIAVSPTSLENTTALGIFNGDRDDNRDGNTGNTLRSPAAAADVCILGHFLNPFPIHSEQARRNGFIKGYQDMQARIQNCHLLNKQTATCNTKDNNMMVDSKETIGLLLEFILAHSYAKDWKKTLQDHPVDDCSSTFDFVIDGTSRSAATSLSVPISPNKQVLLITCLVASILGGLILYSDFTCKLVVLTFISYVCITFMFTLVFLWRVIKIDSNAKEHIENKQCLK